MKVRFTMEKTCRVSEVIDITEEQLQQLRDGNNFLQDKIDFDGGEVTYDYNGWAGKPTILMVG